MITVLCGGVGAAKMLRALRLVVDGSELTGIVNNGDDLTLHGLRICPDLDTITYTLAGLNNQETGWGLTDESWRVMKELSELGGASWFGLGDRDLATHLYRTERLRQGDSLNEITRDLLAHFGVDITLLAATQDPIATVFQTVAHGNLSFQEYFVLHHHDVVVSSIDILGAQKARPSHGVLEAMANAERIVISPSNPLISIGPILALPGIRETLMARRSDVVVISPLIGGKALKGPADRLMEELGLSATSRGVASYYREIASTLIIDNSDSADRSSVEAEGMRCIVTPTIMSDDVVSANLAEVVLHG